MEILTNQELYELKQECIEELYTHPLVALILKETLEEIEHRLEFYL